MGIGRGAGSPFFQRIGAQARPIVKLIGLDERHVEKVGRCVLISVIDKQPRPGNWTRGGTFGHRGSTYVISAPPWGSSK